MNLSDKLTQMETHIFDILIDSSPLPKEIINIILEYCYQFNGIYIDRITLDNKLKKIATDGKNIYACDKRNILIINTKGELLHKTTDMLINPTDLYIYKSKLYVTDLYSKEVLIFKIPSLGLIQSFACQNSAWGIKIYKSKIYVSETTVINVYDLKGNRISSIASEYFIDLYGLSVTNDLIYVCDYVRSDIYILMINGKFLSKLNFFDPYGSGLYHPTKITILNDITYCCDELSAYQCTMEGNVIKKWAPSSGGHIAGFVFLNKKCYVLGRINCEGMITIYE